MYENIIYEYVSKKTVYNREFLIIITTYISPQKEVRICKV